MVVVRKGNPRRSQAISFPVRRTASRGLQRLPDSRGDLWLFQTAKDVRCSADAQEGTAAAFEGAHVMSLLLQLFTTFKH